MIEVGVPAERVELSRVDVQDRAASHPSFDDEVVTRGDRIDGPLVTVHDDVDRGRPRRQMVGEVGAQTRLVLSEARDSGNPEEQNNDGRRAYAAAHRRCRAHESEAF